MTTLMTNVATRDHTVHTVREPEISRLLFADTRLAPLWALLRIYVGYEWLMAGWGKVTSPAWVGADGGAAVSGFLKGALAKT